MNNHRANNNNHTNNNIIRIHFGLSPCAYALLHVSWTFPVPCDLRTSFCTSGLRPSGTTAACFAMKKDKAPPAGWCAACHCPLKPTHSGHKGSHGKLYWKPCLRHRFSKLNEKKQNVRKSSCAFCHQKKELLRGFCKLCR